MKNIYVIIYLEQETYSGLRISFENVLKHSKSKKQ
jgi:hypothetical protein